MAFPKHPPPRPSSFTLRPSPFTASQWEGMATYAAGSFTPSSSSSSSPATNPGSKSPFSGLAKPNVIRKLSRPSEKSSLDLNRPSAEQGLGLYYASEYGSGGSGGGASRSLHDLSVNSSVAARRGWHQRSTSGTSQFSTRTAGSLSAAAAVSAYRGGEGFRHPWQQTPRPYTPPGGSYQGSSAESEGRETPTLGLGEVEETPEQSVLGEALIMPPLRVNTKTSDRVRLPLGTSSSNSLHLGSSLSIFGEHNRDTITNTTALGSLSPSDTVSPTSFTSRSRVSMDRGYRLRSRSEAEKGQVESVREARRKWDEREREKEERVAREQVRQREKLERREARKIEKGGRKSSTSERSRARGDSGAKYSFQEKRGGGEEGLFARDYDSAPVQTPPHTEQEYGQFPPPPPPKHSSPGAEAKKRTHSAWTAFMMWLRTRILRMSKKR